MLGKCSLQHCHSPPFRGRHYCQAKLLGVLAKLNQDQTLLATKLDQLQVAHLFSKKHTPWKTSDATRSCAQAWPSLKTHCCPTPWQELEVEDAQNILEHLANSNIHWISLRITTTATTILWQGACQQTLPKNFVEVQMIRWFADSPKYRTQYTQYAQKQSENILLLCHDSFVRICSDKGVIHFLGRNQVHDVTGQWSSQINQDILSSLGDWGHYKGKKTVFASRR